jgi:hypothetical protein
MKRTDMTTRKAAASEPPPRILTVKDPALEQGKLKPLGGSRSDDFNSVLMNDVLKALWTKHSGEALKDQQYAAVAGGLMGIGPKDELEGMLAAQAMAAHHAAMECYRRAMLPEQSLEAWKEQALPDLRHAPGSVEPPPRQGTAEDQRRARARPCRWAGDRRRR